MAGIDRGLGRVAVDESRDRGRQGFPIGAREVCATDGAGEAPENPPMSAMDGNPATGWGVASVEGKNPFLVLRFAQPVETTGSSVLEVRLKHDSSLRRATIGRVRFALSRGRYSWPELGDPAVEAGLDVGPGRLIKGGFED